jgi:hypothetical protein
VNGIAMAVEAARSLLGARPIECPDDIHVARLAKDCGADVDFRETGVPDGRIVRVDGRALIGVALRARGTPRARWTVAHELGHLLLHRDLDAIERIHGSGPRSGSDYRYEREADAFAAELLMPQRMFAHLCGAKQPTVPLLDRLAREFGTSLTATGRRYTGFASASCAMLECTRGRVRRAARSESFRGEAVKGRVLEEETAAARLFRGEAVPRGSERVTSGAWGSEWLDGEMTEHAIKVVESGDVLVWLWHA